MDREQFRAAAHSAIDEIIDYFDSLPTRRVTPTIQPGYLRPQIPDFPPEEPEDWRTIQADIESKIVPGLTHWQAPNFMAFFPATVSYPSILGELYSAAFTAPAFNWICSPACTELETIVLDWVGKALGLPDCFLSTGETHGGGVIQGTASESIATMMVAARERRLRERALSEGLLEGSQEYEDRIMELRPSLVALASDQAHSSTAKGALIAGTRFRSIPTSLEDNMELTGSALRMALEECEKNNLDPYYITLTFGTTNSCAVDRFQEIKTVLSEKKSWQRIWVHMDAAYAGAALVADEFQPIAKEWSEGVDSFDMNMHKWLLVNFDASCLFVRNRLDLTKALDITPSYLRNPYSELGTVIDYRNWQFSLGRRFRSLKIWFVMRSYGLSGLKAMIRKHIALSDVFTDLVRSRSDLFEIITKPAFCLTVMRVRNPKNNSNTVASLRPKETEHLYALQPDEVSDTLTKSVHEAINTRGEIFITSTVIAGITAIRIVTSNPATDKKNVTRAFEILVETAEEVIRMSASN
ncbi:Pyridoxal phosphate-dependent transferase [Elaphomyces granulatus]